MEKYTLEQAIAKMTEIASNPSPLTGSLFTAENVLTILKSIEPLEVKIALPHGWDIELEEKMVQLIEDDFNDYVDYDDTELELDGDRISVYNVGYKSHRIRNSVKYFIQNTATEVIMPPVTEDEYLCETCDKPQTKEEHEFSDICGDCRELMN